jgi:hypothetical protein
MKPIVPLFAIVKERFLGELVGTVFIPAITTSSLRRSIDHAA